MRIGRRLYPDDEISASEIARRAQQRDQQRAQSQPLTHGEKGRLAIVARFLGACSWQGDMPVKRHRAHDQSLIITALSQLASAPRVLANRPVPRLASCHFDSRPVSAGTTFYFY